MPEETPRHQPAGVISSRVLWILLLVYALVTFTFPFLRVPTFLYAGLVVALGSMFAVAHGVVRYGFKGMLVFIIICLLISNILENVSILTGFPFGFYEYTPALGPKLFAVPLLIGPAYFSTGYLAWTVANVLLDFSDTKLRGLALFVLPLIASFIMVMWDVVMDPTSSTLQQLWIWHTGGGGYFGVPLSNYLGWFFTVYLFFQMFALYLAKKPSHSALNFSKGYWYQAVLMYLVIGLSFVTGFVASSLTGLTGTVADATGATWSIGAIRGSAVIASLFTMCFVSVLALLKIQSYPVNASRK